MTGAGQPDAAVLDVETRCICGHRAGAHRPSGVTPFGRGVCCPKRCGCRIFALPDVDAPTPAYPTVAGARYALLIHRGEPPKDSGRYRAGELVTTVPPVSGDVAWKVGHTLVEPDASGRLPQVYVDWLGGPMHGIYPDAVRISGCGCGQWLHVFGDLLVVQQMTPVLQWVNQHTAPMDWCELVPLLPPLPTGLERS